LFIIFIILYYVLFFFLFYIIFFKKKGGEGYYLINRNGVILTDSGEEGILLNCKDNKCEEVTVPGFYKDINEKYIECYTNYYRCIIAKLENYCNSSHLGKLVKINENDYGLCIAFKRLIFTSDDCENFIVENQSYYQVEEYFILEFSSEKINNHYLIKRNEGTAFSFDKSIDFYALKVDENSISFDKGFTTGKI